jgi:putative ubiquitin-RnfH superfamily antitoxin RatB of RatAB toxin-antitoxin module
MEVSGQLHAIATLPQEKELLTLVVQEAGWAPEAVRMLWIRDKANETAHVSQRIAVYSKTGTSKMQSRSDNLVEALSEPGAEICRIQSVNYYLNIFSCVSTQIMKIFTAIEGIKRLSHVTILFEEVKFRA